MFIIPIRENSSNPLPEITVGRASAFEGKIVGVPADYENVQIAWGQVGNDASFACPCNAKKGGDWGVYATGAYFLTVGKAFYHVTAKTHKGDSVYLGGGTLRVCQSVLNVEPDAVPVIPDECYVRGANGLYYKVTAALDEDGVPYMIVANEGISK